MRSKTRSNISTKPRTPNWRAATSVRTTTPSWATRHTSPSRTRRSTRPTASASTNTRAIQTPDGRIIVDQAKRRELRKIANPLKLGDLTTVSAFVPGHHWKNHFDRREAEHRGLVTVTKLREWMDEPQRCGLPRDSQNPVFMFFATHAQMDFHLHGRLTEPGITDLPEDAELRTQQLPSQNDWDEAGKRAASIFGIVAPQLLNAVNTARLVAEIKTVAQQWKIPGDQLVPLLTNLFQRVGAASTSCRLTATWKRRRSRRTCLAWWGIAAAMP